MQPFSYHHASTLRDATGLLAEPASLALGGGTDLLVWLKEGLAAPRSLVDYVLPSERAEHETILTVGEVVTAVTLPSESARGVQRYYKLMQRGSWDFAIASLGVARRASGDVRLVLR